MVPIASQKIVVANERSTAVDRERMVNRRYDGKAQCAESEQAIAQALNVVNQVP